ncbi:S-layer family protein, partial [Muricauda sp. CAU 1633]|uniref:beta strand repeat-containing protein n=1 Tax=Allomuricauda sp. CAU 1633 TaxID=2816036 RepID=UPI001A8F9F92
ATNTSDITTNATNIATNTTDIATNATNIATNAADIATNTADIATNTADIATNATDIANHIAADGDTDAGNEFNTSLGLNGTVLELVDGGGLLSDDLDAVFATDAELAAASDDDITGATLDAPSNVLTISEGTTDVTVDLSDLDDSAGVAANAANITTNTSDIATNTADIATNATNIATNTANIATNTSDIATNASDIATNATDIATNTADIATNATDIANHIAADGDTDAGNEYNTGSGITGGSLEITDGGGTESVNLISGDANNNLTAGSDGALYLNVASVSIAETNTSLSFNGATSELTYTNELGNNPVVDISSLDDSSGVAANAANIATNTTDIATNTSDIATNASDIATNTADIATNATNIATNTANIATNTSDIATNTSDIATNTTNIATNTSDIATNATNIATNTSDIATNAANITTNVTNIATNTADIATNASDIATNSSNIATNTADIATNATDIANHIAADGDTDAGNEFNTSLGLNGTVLELVDGGGLLSDDLDAVFATDAELAAASDDDITGASLDAPSNVLTISEGTTDVTVDLSDLDDSAGVTANAANIATNTSDIATNTSDITTNATNIATNTTDIATNATNIATNAADIATNTADIATNTADIATNATDIANHIAADGDTDAGNEFNTSLGLNGTVLELVDGGGLLSDDLDEVFATDAELAAASDDDITGASLDAPSNVLTISEGTTDVTVDLSDLDDSAGVAANAANIATNTSDIATNTADIATNATDIATNASDIATNTADIATNTSDIATNATNIATNATDIANHIAADSDTDAGNEFNTSLGLNGTILELVDGGGLLSDDLDAVFATDAELAAASDDDITGASLDAPSNVLTISEGTTDVTVDLSDLDDSAGVAANAANIATNTSDIATNASDIATNSSNIATNATNIATNTADIATNATDIANHIAADGDTDAGNEFNTSLGLNGTVLELVDGGGLLSDDLDAVFATDAELAAASDDDITGASLDAPSNVLTISEGTTDVTVDLSDLDDSAGVAANAANIATNTSDITSNTSDIATNATNIATNTSDVATNTADIATNTTDIATNATDIANHIAADGDTDAGNEFNTSLGLNGTVLELVDGGGLLSDDLDAVFATDAELAAASDDDITGATLDAPSNVLTISEGTTDVTVDLSDLDDSAGVAANAANIATNTSDIATNTGDIATNAADIATNTSDIATNATNIATNTSDIATNATDIANHIAADGDTDAGNEYNTGSGITGGSLEITDGGGTESVNLISGDANNNLTAGSDGALYLNVASVSIAETNTSLSFNGATSELTYTNELGNNPVVDISSLDDSSGVAANAANIATNTSDIATNASDIATNASDIATNTAGISTNATNITTNTSDIATNATNIATNATDIANHIAADGDTDAGNEFNTSLGLNGTVLELVDGGGLLSDDLDAVFATDAELAAASDDDITGASLDAPSNVLTISEGTTDVTVDLSDLDDSAGVAANAANIATNASDIATNATNIATNTTNIATNTSDIATNTSDIATNATNIATNATNIATNTSDIATNATDIANHIAADGDTDAGNEFNTSLGLNGTVLELVDGGGLLSDDLDAVFATDAELAAASDDDITGASLDAPSNVLTISEGTTDVTVDLSDLDDSAGVAANAANIATNTTDIATNATNIATNASDIATNTSDIATNTTNIATNTADIATNATNIATNATDIANHIAADGDTDAGNEFNTSLGLNGTVLELVDGGGLLSDDLDAVFATDAELAAASDDDITGATLDAPSNVLTISEGTTDVTVDLSDLDDSAGVAANAANIATNTSDIATNATNIATNATDIANHIAADGDTDAGNEFNTSLGLNGTVLELVDGGGLLSDDLDAVFATDAELAAASDDDITGASLDAPSNVLTISEGTTDVTVDLSDLDDSAGVAANAAYIATNATNIATNTSDIATNASDIATNTSDIATNATNIATNTSDIATNASNIATNTADIATNTSDIATNATSIANHIAADGDTDAGNEYNTNFTVTGGNLRITDGGGNLDVPLTSIDTDDQTASEVNSDSPVDVDGDGNTESTVEDVIQDIAPITSKAARIFYPPSIAIDASTNGTGRTVDLYAQYVAQYGTPTVASTGAPAAIPTYAATDLYYYVTYADPSVFDNMSIDANGELTYDIVGQPADYNALINVVFVVK